MQKKIVDEAGISPSFITIDTLKERLTSFDFFQIFSKTSMLLQEGRLLNKFGFEKITNNNNCISEDGCNIDLMDEINSTSVVLNAVCPDKESITIWESDSENNANNMNHSILNIVQAMYRVMRYDEIIRTKQFKICFMNYNNLL